MGLHAEPSGTDTVSSFPRLLRPGIKCCSVRCSLRERCCFVQSVRYSVGCKQFLLGHQRSRSHLVPAYNLFRGQPRKLGVPSAEGGGVLCLIAFMPVFSSLLFPRGLSKQLSFVGSVQFQAVPCWGCVCKGEVHMSCPLYQQHFSTCRMHLSNWCCYFISYVAFWSLSITFRHIGKSFHRFLLEPHSSPKKARQV